MPVIKCSVCGSLFEPMYSDKCPKCGATFEEILEKIDSIASELSVIKEARDEREFMGYSALDGESVVLEWKQLPKDVGYVIYHSADRNNYEKLAELPVVESIRGKAKFTHKDVSLGEKHWYKIAVRTVDGEEFFVYGDFPSFWGVTLKKTEAKCELEVVPASNETSITLRWDRLPGDTHYVIYHSIDGKDYEKLEEIAKELPVFYVHENITLGETHFYEIAAKVLEDKELEPSEPVAVQKRKFWAEPAEGGKSLILKWQQFPSDEGYVIYYSANNQNYEKLAELEFFHTTFRHKDLSSGKGHSYKIAAKNHQGKELPTSEPIYVFLKECQ